MSGRVVFFQILLQSAGQSTRGRATAVALQSFGPHPGAGATDPAPSVGLFGGVPLPQELDASDVARPVLLHLIERNCRELGHDRLPLSATFFYCQQHAGSSKKVKVRIP